MQVIKSLDGICFVHSSTYTALSGVVLTNSGEVKYSYKPRKLKMEYGVALVYSPVWIEDGVNNSKYATLEFHGKKLPGGKNESREKQFSG